MTSFNPEAFLDSSVEGSDAPERSWSKHQEAIFEAITHPDQSLIIQAVAGSGKTTTLVEALRYAPGSALFMAFNKAIAQDIAGKVPRGDVKTLNALGHRLWMLNAPGAKLDFDKTKKLIEKHLPKDVRREYGYIVGRLVSAAKNAAVDITGSQDEMVVLEDMLGLARGNDSLAPGQVNDAAIYATKVFIDSRADLETFDFDDQLYAPIYHRWTYPHYDNVFIDECQDLSPIQHLMLSEFSNEGARIVAVGDRHQAIYGFRGADTASMDNLKSRFGMIELPLSVTYRCSQNVVKEAQVYCPSIIWRDSAPEGSVLYRDRISWDGDPHLFTRELVICRNNAPLFRAILRHVREKSPCRVLSNFIDTLQGFIRGIKARDLKDLIDKVDRWEEKELQESEDNDTPWRAGSVSDKAETIRLLASQSQDIEDILILLKRLGDSREGPTFATIHKSKGLEADSVYILAPNLVPSPFARGEAPKQQERNLAYVAITRAKTLLTYGSI